MRNRLLMFTLALALSASLAQAKDPVQARKDLTSMGLAYNNTPQFLEALRGKDQIAIDLFLDAKGVDLNARDPKTGKSALRIAYDARDAELTKRLIALGAKPASGDVEEALKRNDRGMYFDMLRVAPDTLTERLAFILLERKDKDLLRQTMAHAEGENAARLLTPLVLANTMYLHKKDIGLLDEMLKRLGPAAKQVLDQPKVVQRYNDYHNWHGLRLLTISVNFQAPDFDVIGLLVKYGADVNAIDPVISRSNSSDISNKLPLTPLFNSVWAVNEHAVRALLEHGADPNALLVRQSGFLGFAKRQTALSYAEGLRVEEKSIPKRERIVAILKGAGAKVPEELQAKGAGN